MFVFKSCSSRELKSGIYTEAQALQMNKWNTKLTSLNLNHTLKFWQHFPHSSLSWESNANDICYEDSFTLNQSEKSFFYQSNNYYSYSFHLVKSRKTRLTLTRILHSLMQNTIYYCLVHLIQRKLRFNLTQNSCIYIARRSLFEWYFWKQYF